MQNAEIGFRVALSLTENFGIDIGNLHPSCSALQRETFDSRAFLMSAGLLAPDE
jgi:hypothetical protein